MGGVQLSKMVLRNMEHVFQISSGRGIGRATEALHRNRGSAALLISFFIRGQVKPLRGVQPLHVPELLKLGGTFSGHTHVKEISNIMGGSTQRGGVQNRTIT